MSSKTYLIPARGEPLPHPGGVLPAGGEYVEEIDLFWRRRLKHGDVVIGKPPKAAPAPSAGDDSAVKK